MNLVVCSISSLPIVVPFVQFPSMCPSIHLFIYVLQLQVCFLKMLTEKHVLKKMQKINLKNP